MPVIRGQIPTTERPKTLAAQRAVNTKAYLTSGENQKAVDASRIESRTSTADENKVEVWIVPEGATFDQPTTPVNEARVKPQSRKPAAAPAKRASKPRRKAAAPTK